MSSPEAAPPYRHWPITERPEVHYPDGKRMACYIGLNIEHFSFGKRAVSRSGTSADLPVDPANYAWRDYGVRVGFWRLLQAIDRFDLPVSTLLNTTAAERYPEIVQAGRERGWAFLGHGTTNDALWTGMDLDTERARLLQVVDTLTRTTGARPKGWLGPALTETANTVGLLAELGFSYTLDWIADDQPFPVDAGGHRFASVPYSMEINDIPALVGQSLTPTQFTELIVDQFEVLHEESKTRPGAVLCIALHPFLVGQPFRYRHLLEAFEAISGHDDVWYANTDEIADWYLAQHYDQALAALDARGAR